MLCGEICGGGEAAAVAHTDEHHAPVAGFLPGRTALPSTELSYAGAVVSRRSVRSTDDRPFFIGPALG